MENMYISVVNSSIDFGKVGQQAVKEADETLTDTFIVAWRDNSSET